ncbi:MAG: SDR family oxidoreductase [Labilithrix sp.]|nr:SDR family oxidoreductase [Labilithrix sp.]MBX3224487.1 SDR family oxidoreductase [Labilithrix sp.]
MAESKVAIVTGASSGIGLAVAKRWTERGGRVALVARSRDKLEAAALELGPERAVAFPLDVVDLDALTALPGRVADLFGRLDVVVNNAGLNHRGPVDRFEPAELAAVVTTNLVAPIVLTRAALPRLTRGGSVVQLASIAGMVPVPGEAAYSASKAGLRAFARAVGYDVEERGIHVGCVCPGPVDTGFLGDLEEVPDIVLSQPMITADEVALAVLQCIDERLEEIALPARSGRLATMAYLAPSFARKIRPVLEKRGARNKAALLAARRRAVS